MDPTNRTCRVCGSCRPSEEWTYVGLQDCTDGEWLALLNCPVCGATHAGKTLVDVSRCSACDDVIVGNRLDPKIVALVQTTEGLESRIFCMDCDAHCLPHRKPRPHYVPMAARMY